MPNASGGPTKPRRWRAFTAAEDAQILDMVAAGADHAVIALALDRGVSVVHSRATKLLRRLATEPAAALREQGRKKRLANLHGQGPRWTRADEARLIDDLDAGVLQEDTAKAMGRSKNSIAQRVTLLRRAAARRGEVLPAIAHKARAAAKPKATKVRVPRVVPSKAKPDPKPVPKPRVAVAAPKVPLPPALINTPAVRKGLPVAVLPPDPAPAPAFMASTGRLAVIHAHLAGLDAKPPFTAYTDLRLVSDHFAGLTIEKVAAALGIATALALDRFVAITKPFREPCGRGAPWFRLAIEDQRLILVALRQRAELAQSGLAGAA